MATSGQSSLLGCVAKNGGSGSGSGKSDNTGSRDEDDDDARISRKVLASTTISMDLLGQPTFTMNIHRNCDGFGFTVSGCSPVQVGRVEIGSPAWSSELQQDDCIIKINGLNVSRSTAESVAKLVRNSKTQITLEIFRPLNRNNYAPQLQLQRHRPQQLHCNSDSGVVADYSTISSSSSSTTFRSDSIDDVSHLETSSMTSSTSSSLFHSARPTADARSYYISNETENEWDFHREFPGNLQQRKPLMTVTNKLLTGQGQKFNCMVADGRDSLDSVSSRTGGCLPKMGLKSKRSPPSIRDTGGNSNDVKVPDEFQRQREPRYRESPHEDLDLTWSCEVDSKLGACLEEMVSCLEDFVVFCQLGVNRFLKPLRAARLPQDQFKTLFQNIEMILTLSEQLLRKLKFSTDTSIDSNQSANCLSSHVTIEALVSFLDVKMDSMCDNYERYCNGLRQALIAYVALKKDARFGPVVSSFSNNNNNFDADGNAACSVSLSSFLQQPLKHVKDLVVLLQSLTSLSARTGHENEKLKKIIYTLRLCCNRINENHRSLSNLSLNTITSSVLSLAQHGLHSTPTKNTGSSPANLIRPPTFSPSLPSSPSSSNSEFFSPLPSSVVSSIDKQLLDIQTRLVFPSGITAFHLATASRHLIYSGNLELVDYDGGRCTVFVVLTSDILLITRQDYMTQVLNVIEDPIVLQNIVGCEFHNASPLELLISVETRLTTLQKPWAPKVICLRAPSEDLKSTWKNILEQRILTCKYEREVTLAARSMDNIV